MLHKGNGIRILLVVNALAMSALLVGLLVGFRSKNVYDSLQAKELTILSEHSKSKIYLGFEKQAPRISMKNAKGDVSFEIEGTDQPKLTLYQNQKPVAFFSASENGGVDLILNDQHLTPKIHLTSSQVPGIFLKNDLNKTVGSWTIVNDGGAGFGLADGNGFASTLLRGGLNPSIAFFHKKSEPLAAFGIMQTTPHLLISGQQGSEGILIHGGQPNSFLVVDEKGKVRILISKKGIFQGKEDNSSNLKKKDEKILSLEDHDRLFPDKLR